MANKIYETLKFHMEVHQGNETFKKLGFGPATHENSKLLGKLAKFDAELEAIDKEAESQAKLERRQAAIARVRTEVGEWRQEVGTSYASRVALAKKQLTEAIAKRLDDATTDRRKDFLWRQLERMGPLELQQLYSNAPNEVRAAIATMPPKLLATDMGSSRLVPAIDPDFVMKTEQELHPQEARQVEVLTSLANAFDYLGNVADQQIEEV